MFMLVRFHCYIVLTCTCIKYTCTRKGLRTEFYMHVWKLNSLWAILYMLHIKAVHKMIVFFTVKITVQPRDMYGEIGGSVTLQCLARVIGSSASSNDQMR